MYSFADLRRFCVKIRVAGIEPVTNAMRFEGHRAQEATDRRATEVPAEATRQEISQRPYRPTRKCPAKLLRCLDNNRRELLPDVVLDFRGPAGTRTVAQAVEACFQVALDPAPDDLPIDRQAGAE